MFILSFLGNFVTTNGWYGHTSLLVLELMKTCDIYSNAILYYIKVQEDY